MVNDDIEAIVMLDRPPTSFVISPAAAQWSLPKGARQRFLTRRRTRAFRQREKDSDRVRFYKVQMRDSDVIALLHDVELVQRGDQFTPRELGAMVDKQWIEMVGGVIAQAALLAVKKRR